MEIEGSCLVLEVCKSPDLEDEVLEALEAQQGVEQAVPDTWIQWLRP